MDEWRKEPFLHTMLNLLEWNSANQKFKNYANPTNLANYWMPMMLLFHSNDPPLRSIPVHSPSSFALFRALNISLKFRMSATCCLLGNILLSRIRELENVSQYAE